MSIERGKNTDLKGNGVIMPYEINGKEATQEEVMDLMEDDDAIVTNLAIEFPNENKSVGPTTMEGFDIEADYLIFMVNTCTEMNASVTATFSNCGKLGGKTVIITVQDADHPSKENQSTFWSKLTKGWPGFWK